MNSAAPAYAGWPAKPPRVATFDLESDGFLEDATVIWCGVIKDHETEEVFTYHIGDRYDDYLASLTSHLDTYDVLVGHNSIGFDFPLLRKVTGYDYKGKLVDTMIMSRSQRPKRRPPPNAGKYVPPNSVEAWGYRLDSPKQEHEDWSKFSPKMLERCVQDVHIQHRLYYHLMEEARGEGWMESHKLNFRLFDLLARQQEFGWRVDQEKMHANVATLTRWIDKIDRAMKPHLPLVLNIKEVKKDGEYGWVKKPFLKSGKHGRSVVAWADNDTDLRNSVVGPFSRIHHRLVDLDRNIEVKRFLLDSGWQPAEWNTNDSGERTSPKLSLHDPFDGIQGSLGKLVSKRVQCKQRRGVIEGLVEAVREDGRIPAVVTGLASTARARHSVIVNIPRASTFFGTAMRSMFIASDGWVLVGTDSAGNQARQLAARMGDPEFIDACLGKSGTDIHTLNQRKAGLPTRNMAKTFFYALIFGAGDGKISEITGGTRAEAKAIKERYFREMSEFARVVDDLTTEWKQTAKKWFNKKWNRYEYHDGFFKGLDGRPILTESEHMLIGYAVQSDEAIQMARAYILFVDWMGEEGFVLGTDYGMVIWMHDEFQIDCAPYAAATAAELSCRAIKEAGEYYDIACPHEGTSKYGVNWSETH